MNVSGVTYAASATQWSNFTHFLNSSLGRWSGLILATSATALVGLGVYRWSQASKQGQDEYDADFDEVKQRVSRTYGYVFGGFALTALAAVTAHVSGFSQKILQNGLLAASISIGSCIALIATLLTDKENGKAKHVAWAIFNVTMGMMLSPIGYLNQKVVAQAAAISLGLGGAITLAAYLAPDRSFLAWQGPLMAALTSISIASCVALFFPGSAFAYGVDRASLYGGLAIFSMLLASSTQRLMEEAETQYEEDFDPINSSMSIYLDGMNIFIRILRIMLENQKEENS